MRTPVAFISYSHDSKEHKAWVLQLAKDLRAAGVDVILDHWDLSPGQDVTLFMQNGIGRADRVLLVCTEKYVSKADGASGGVGYERLVITSEVVAAIETAKFVPLVRTNNNSDKIPTYLGPRLYIDFSKDADYTVSLEALCRELLGAPANPKPPLGVSPFATQVPVLAEKPRSDRKTSVARTRQASAAQRTAGKSNRAHDDLIDLLAEWTGVIYEVKVKARRAEQNNTLWPGDEMPLVLREDNLYTRILGRLNRDDAGQDQIARGLDAFREIRDPSEWTERRAGLMSVVARVLRR